MNGSIAKCTQAELQVSSLNLPLALKDPARVCKPGSFTFVKQSFTHPDFQPLSSYQRLVQQTINSIFHGLHLAFVTSEGKQKAHPYIKLLPRMSFQIEITKFAGMVLLQHRDPFEIIF